MQCPKCQNENRDGAKFCVEPLQFEMLLSELFAAFVNIQDSEFDDKINYALRRIVQVLKIDRCYLMQYRYDTKHFVVTHSWVAEGIPNINLIGVGSADAPWVAANYAGQNKIFHYNRLDDFFLSFFNSLHFSHDFQFASF